VIIETLENSELPAKQPKIVEEGKGVRIDVLALSVSSCIGEMRRCAYCISAKYALTWIRITRTRGKTSLSYTTLTVNQSCGDMGTFVKVCGRILDECEEFNLSSHVS
jgi:hypothetical protein